MQGKRRCRLHGGASTGPRTAEGIERIKRARTKHGFYTAEMVGWRRQWAEDRRWAKELLRRAADLHYSCVFCVR